jgi:hypothetical protein
MSITSLFNQTITVYPKTSNDRYGRVVIGAGSSNNCRFQKINKIVLLPTGQTKVINAIVYAQPDLNIHVNDRVDYSSESYQVFGLSEAVDGNGVINHLKLELTKWQTTST